MKLTAKQYIDWALHDLVEYAKLLPIRSELPDLYGKSRLFDAAVVTNRVGRFVPVGLLLCAFMLGLVAERVGGALITLVTIGAFAGLMWGGWTMWRFPGVLVGLIMFIPILFMEPETWLRFLKFMTGLGLVYAGWRVLAALGAVVGVVLALTMIYMPPLRSLPQEAQVLMSVLMAVGGWSILSRSAVVVAFKAADGLAFTELVSELKQLSRLIPSPGSVDAFEYFGALVLVFEQPVPAAKRDQLISLRQSSPLGRMLTDIWIVELDAGTMYALDTPWNVKFLIPALEDSLGRKGDAPAWEPPAPTLGQRTARTSMAWATMGLVAVNTLIHVAVYTEHAESESLRVFRAGVSHAEMRREGQHWRSVTHMFLHADKWHLLGNMVGLLEAGRSVELLFGTGWTMALYLLTGLGATWLSDRFLDGLGLGASGAVFGLAGTLLAVFVFRGRRLSLRYRSHLMVLAAYIVFSLILGLSAKVAYVNHWAHLGGALTGMAAGLLLPFKQEDGPTRAGGSWFGLVAAAVCVWAFMTAVAAWDWAPARFDPVRSEAHRLVIERPQGWFQAVDGQGTLVFDNGYGGAVAASRESGDIRGMVTMPAGELRQYFEEMYRRMEGTRHLKGRHWRQPDEVTMKAEVRDFSAQFIELSEGKALSVTFTYDVTGTYFHYFLIPERIGYLLHVEDIYLPLAVGFQHLLFQSAGEDVEYYRPVFDRIKKGFRSLEPAFGSMSGSGESPRE